MLRPNCSWGKRGDFASKSNTFIPNFAKSPYDESENNIFLCLHPNNMFLCLHPMCLYAQSGVGYDSLHFLHVMMDWWTFKGNSYLRKRLTEETVETHWETHMQACRHADIQQCIEKMGSWIIERMGIWFIEWGLESLEATLSFDNRKEVNP